MYLCYASKDSLDLIRKFISHVSIEDYLTKATIRIIDKQTIIILLGSGIIDENILGILPQLEKVAPCTSNLVSILAMNTSVAYVNVSIATASEAITGKITATKKQVEVPVGKQ